MKRLLLAMLLAVSAVVFSCSCAFVHPFGAYQSQRDYREYSSSLRVHVWCPNGDEYAGTAFAVGPSTAITAAHVLSCEDQGPPVKIELLGREDKVYQAEVGIRADGADAESMYLLNGEVFPVWSELQPNKVSVGQTVCLIGGDGSLNIYGLRKCGDVATVLEDGRIVVSLRSVPGNSGSPVFDDEGYVVGLLSMGRWGLTIDAVSILVPAKDFRGLVK
jgi:V8-like Glu-specific endopeptidase